MDFQATQGLQSSAISTTTNFHNVRSMPNVSNARGSQVMAKYTRSSLDLSLGQHPTAVTSMPPCIKETGLSVPAWSVGRMQSTFAVPPPLSVEPLPWESPSSQSSTNYRSMLEAPRDSFFDVIAMVVDGVDFSQSSDAEVQHLRSLLEDVGHANDNVVTPSSSGAHALNIGSSGYQGMFPSISPVTASRPPSIAELAGRVQNTLKRPLAFSDKDSHGSDAEDVDARLASSKRSSLAIVGEARLKIRFESFGRLGVVSQRFGKSGLLVADGLCGTHEMYEQPWRFEVRQGKKVDDDVAVITWKIINLSSGVILSVTETAKQARVRQHSGRTICNKVLREALTIRYNELDRQVRTLHDNPTREANIRSLMKVIAPRRCTVGLLFFGLLHESVQQRLQEEFTQRMPGLTSASSSGTLNSHSDDLETMSSEEDDC